MGLALKDTEHYCYGDYLTWTDEPRYELVDGLAYAMSPAPDLAHQDVAGEIYRQVANALRRKPCRVFIAPVDVRLPKHNEADQFIDTVVQPDVLVVCDTGKLDKRGVRGAPDWVVEVLSSSTASHDQIRKRKIYECHGVKEYWLVHPSDRVLTVYCLEQGEFGKPELYDLAATTPVSVLPGVEIDWDELVTRLPTEY